ncbi:MAG: PEGA domain-containing protein [bacterium]
MNLLPKDNDEKLKRLQKPDNLNKKSDTLTNNYSNQIIQPIGNINNTPIIETEIPINKIEKTKKVKAEKVKKVKVIKEKKIKPEKQHSSFNRSFYILLTVSILLLILVSTLLVTILIQLRNAELYRVGNFSSVFVNTIPTKANVYINNYYKGITPIELKNVSIETKITLTVMKDGYKDFEKEISKDDLQTSFDISMEKLQTSASSEIKDLGLSVDGISGYTLSNQLVTLKCKDLKDSLVDPKKCTNDDNEYKYIDYKIINDKDNSGIEIRPFLAIDNCLYEPSKYSTICKESDNKNVTKQKTINFLGQETDVMQIADSYYFLKFKNSSTTSEFNNIFIKSDRMDSIQFYDILSSFTKNASVQ